MKNPVINDVNEINDLNQKFETMLKQISVRIFTSNLSEKSRFIFWSYKKSFKLSLNELINKFFEATLKDLNNNLKIEDVFEGCYLNGGTKNKGKVAKINKFDIEHGFMTMSWISDEALVEREIKIKPSFLKKQVSNVYISEKVTGLKALQGLQGMYLRNDYIKNRVLNYQIGLLNFEISINPQKEKINKRKIETIKKILAH